MVFNTSHISIDAANSYLKSIFAPLFHTMKYFCQSHTVSSFLLGLLCCFFTLSLRAQVNNGKASQYSDQQIIQLWQQAQKMGMSENDALKMLAQRGMSASDINSFKKRLVQLQTNSRSKFSPQNLIKDTTAFLRDSSWVTEVPEFKKASPYYGFDFFNNPKNAFQPNLNLATPANYVLGINDQLTVTLTGLNEITNTTIINREGNYEVPHGGFVKLNGLTIEQAIKKIKDKLKIPYPGLVSGRTQLFLTLENVRSIRVSVIGEAENPGDYQVSAVASFFNVLYLSGGPSRNGSLRKIELIRHNQLLATIDFYSFLQKGILPENIRLEDQDVIRIPVYEKRVSLNGEVKRSAIYELLEKETLADLLQYGGGMGDLAFKESLKIVQVGNKERNVRDVAAADYSYFIPRNADSVTVEKISSRYTNKVAISGAVQRPGNYELSKGLTLSQLIQKADGLREDAFLSRGYVIRTTPDLAEHTMVSFDVTNVLRGAVTDITLVREDSVVILAKDSLRDMPTISVGGNVRNPGSFQFRQGISLEDAIFMAGGFTIDAANHKVEVSRLEKNKADTLANRLLTVLTLEVDSSLRNPDSKTLLQPLDYIFVPKLLNYRSLGSVKLRGEVLYSGDYAMERRDETVQDIIIRAGGITPFASMNNVQIYRNNLRVSVVEKLLLLPGDSIYIPRNLPFVEVQGAVFNPQILSYGSGNFLSYISNSGGVTDKGNLAKAYIQYSNGINKKIKRFLGIRTYPKVLPGSKIIIPEKPEGQKRGLSIIEISALTGSITALVSLIAVLRK